MYGLADGLKDPKCIKASLKILYLISTLGVIFMLKKYNIMIRMNHNYLNDHNKDLFLEY